MLDRVRDMIDPKPHVVDPAEDAGRSVGLRTIVLTLSLMD